MRILKSCLLTALLIFSLSAHSLQIITLGDSLTAGTGDSEYDFNGVELGYSSRLKAIISQQYATPMVKNFGRDGWSTGELIEGADWGDSPGAGPSQLNSALSLISSAEKNIVLVWIGVNDLYGLYQWMCEVNDPLSCPQEDAQDYAADIEIILKKLTEAGAVVYIALLDDVSKRPVIASSAFADSFEEITKDELPLVSAQVTRYNQEIQRLAKQYNVTTVDFFNTTILEQNSTLSEDGNHPNAAGYDQIAQIWFDAIEVEISGTASSDDDISPSSDTDETTITMPVVDVNYQGKKIVSSTSGHAFNVSLSLQANDYKNMDADWWFVIVNSEGQIQYFDVSQMNFSDGLETTLQIPLLSFSDLPLPITIKEAGHYYFIFAIDTINNGQLDVIDGKTFFNFIEINITNTGNIGSDQSAFITYSYNDNVYRVDAVKGAQAESISEKLNQLSANGSDPVADLNLNASPNGQWMILDSDRFHAECQGWGCLTVTNRDVTSAFVVKVNGAVVHPDSGAAVIDSSGTKIIYSSEGDSHHRDLWLLQRNNVNENNWQPPVLLTADSPFSWNVIPAIADDGSKLLFQCGNEAYDSHTVCEVKTDGSGFRILIDISTIDSVRTPDYTPDGSVVLEIDTSDGNELLYRLNPQTLSYEPINSQFNNDNSPCVLADGSIASLWIENDLHELKIMKPDGSSYFKAVAGIDIDDFVLGCGN
ncbi:MAG: hypothetical protein KZQ83_03410 [gamma proteobacterium symbiont of Taylorina sp.]|nr:hypothetical protein [gamma proteobacterium symbiont of Taylorina sp.]